MDIITASKPKLVLKLRYLLLLEILQSMFWNKISALSDLVFEKRFEL
jgi:hypothetical protein